MFTLDWFWGAFSFVAAFFAMLFLIGKGLDKKEKFWLRFSLCAVFFLGFMFFWRAIFYPTYGDDPSNYPVWYLLFYVIYYLAGAFAIFLCYKCDFWSALYISTMAYSCQHITERVYELVVLYQDSVPLLEWFVLLASITAVVYAIFYFTILRKLDYDSFNMIVDHKILLFLSTITIAFSIFLNARIVSLTTNVETNIHRQIVLYTYLFSITVCILSITLQLSFISAKRERLEKEHLNELLEAEKKNFESDKAERELLNIKYHDIKHLLNNANPNMDPIVFKEIKNTLGLYESNFKTGNEAIDVILAKKAKSCQEKKIALSCLIDGTKLSAFAPYECYSLFENAIDNTIEAVEKCPEEKRIISITQQGDRKDYKLIFTNYFNEDITFKKGLPQTKKTGGYHGYGIKSMNMLVKKHDGRLEITTKGDIFMLILHFPQKGA